MPAQEAKYGEVHTSRGSFHDGEPLFLIRATDPLAPLAITDYARRCEEAGCSPEYVRALKDRAHEVAQWQADNLTLVKDKPD